MSEWIAKTLEHLLDFSNILNASIAASWMVLAVIVLRFLLKKAPRWIHVALWGLVAVRLLLPFYIESSLSLIPSVETIPHELLRVEGTQLQEPAYLDVVSNPIFTNGASVEIGQTIDRVQEHMIEMTLIWLIGIAVLLIYTLTSYWYLRRKVNEAVILRDNIFQSENAGSPFVLGIIKPRIYLPYKIEEQTLVHVIAHEQAHIQRKDHWWKPLGFLILTLHWFNPLMWLGYVLLCRDIELACDEKVIKDIDNEQRANYSQALVACSVKRPMIAACPLAFGEVGVKERVRSVLNYKKPAFWIIVVAVVACIVIAVCFLTNPKTRFTVPENSIEKVTVFHATVNDGMSRELSPAQISEMVGRFSGINRAKRSEQYAGFTPGYQLCLFMKDGSNIYANGYNFADNSKVEIVYDGKRYAITDDDFSKYLINICAGNDTTEAVMVGNATKWFDCLHGDEMVWDGMREINLDEFPGVTFRAYSERIEAVTDKETVTLYTGMSIWSVYFCDLTGDGLPELCSSLSFGSGMIDNRVIIYDYANGVSYSMENRGVTDYILRQNESDGQLYVDKKAYMGGGLLSTGQLVFEDDCLQVLWLEKPNDSIREITDPTDDPNFTYDTAVEKIFEDENNEYYIGGLYSQHIIVYYTDGTQENIVTALNAGKATIVDLDKFGIRYWAEPKEASLDTAISSAILEHYASKEPDGLIHVESHVLLANEAMSGTPQFGADDHAEKVIAYLLVHHVKYSTYGGTLEAVGGSYIPTAITFKITDSGKYVLEEYWEPRDGSYYAKDIRGKFPSTAADDALNDQAYIEDLKKQNYNKALSYLNSNISLDVQIEELLNEIQSSPAHSSNPKDYIREHESEYNELIGYGKYTLQYCFSEFLNGEQTDLRGHIMALACKDISNAWGEAFIIDGDAPVTGQGWFDEFQKNAEALAKQYSIENLEKYYPQAFCSFRLVMTIS